MEFFLTILLAHLLGDFVFQPKRWVDNKFSKKALSPALYLHILVHGILATILIALFDAQQALHYWPAVVIIIFSHYFIDLGKAYVQQYRPAIAFITDQTLHLTVLVGIACYYDNELITSLKSLTDELLLLSIALLLLTRVASMIIKLVISRWQHDIQGISEADNSLANAGNMIGILERLFVFGFTISNQISAIGLILAAKSILRYGDLKNANDRKLTEYVLIGTLLSFGIAILTGIGYLFLKEWVN